MLKNMTLNEIIKIEEKLLILNEKYKQELSFNEVVRLKFYMKNIAEITNVYFELIESYQKNTIVENSNKNTTSSIVNDMYDYNDKLQQSEVDVDLINLNEIVGFIKIISQKYKIVFSI